MEKLLDTLLTVVLGNLSNATRGFTRTFGVLEDFFYVKFRGLSFIVLGSRQTGKTTLIEWLRRNMGEVEDFRPDPTTAGGDVVPDFSARVDAGRLVKLRPGRDVGGEYAMWDTDWVELFREVQPRGILFLIDHTEPYLHKDALNFVLQLIDDQPQYARNLRAFYVLINKQDLWGETQSLDDLLQFYKNEQRRLKGQAERFGYAWSISAGSVMTGQGVRETIERFFDTIRPTPRNPRP